MIGSNGALARARADERGAIMVIAVFMAVFLVGLLYYAIGIGVAIIEREGLQDAADTTALSAAVMHARAMNFVVLLNLVMAALLAVLVALKLVEGLAILGMAVAAGLAFITAGASLAFVPPLKQVQALVNETYETVKEPVFTGIEVLHETADGIRVAAPEAARAVAFTELEAGSGGEPPGLVLTPIATPLPIEDDSFDVLCNEAGKNVADVALLPFGDPPGFLRSAFRGAMHAMTSTLTEWFCGDSGGGPPSSEHSVTTSYPMLDSARACRDGTDDPAATAVSTALPLRSFASIQCDDERAEDTAPPDDAKTTESCRSSQEERWQAAPDCETGACRPETDCSPSGPYERSVALARVQCDPRGSPRPQRYDYQLRRGRVAYDFVRGEGWVRREPEYDAPRRVRGSVRPPCGAANASVGREYAVTTHPAGDSAVVLPVCSNELAPVAPPPRGRAGAREWVDFTEVVHILGCEKEEKLTITLEADSVGGHEGGERAPKAVVQGLELGSEAFQIRAILSESLGQGGALDALRIPLWGHEPLESPLTERLERLGGIAWSQAEYFYNGAEGRDAWMWNMKWKARFRVFRAPAHLEETHRACRQSLDGSSCAKVLGAVSRLSQRMP